MKNHAFAFLTGLQFLSLSIFAGTVPQSANVISFGDDKTLLVGDSKSATLYAYSVTATENSAAQSGYNLAGIDYKVAEFLKHNG